MWGKILVALAIVAVIVSGAVLFLKPGEEENDIDSGIEEGDLDSGIEENGLDSGAMEFPALALCRQTGGSWESVSSEDYPVDPENGVYSPTTNPEINYKCFCPAGKRWDMEEGCR